MTNYASWNPIHRAMCPEPGPRDLFVVILIEGKRVGFQHITDYASLRVAAERLAREHECHVKLLPMNGGELMNFLGIEPAAPQPIENMDPAFREQAIKNCMDAPRPPATIIPEGSSLAPAKWPTFRPDLEKNSWPASTCSAESRCCFFASESAIRNA